MSAYKCDVCGALFERDVVPDVCITVYRHPYGTERLDLCSACQAKLEKWVFEGIANRMVGERQESE